MYWEFQKERKEKKEEIYKTILAENFPKLMSDTKPQIDRNHRKLQKQQAGLMSKAIASHIIFKLQKMKDKGKKSQNKPEGKRPYV